ncbi:hypothetical protein ACQJBY_008341 [Aegilops geniculata]
MESQTSEAEKEMREWCVALPKVELHAHLNGSVRNSTLLSVPLHLSPPQPQPKPQSPSSFGPPFGSHGLLIRGWSSAIGVVVIFCFSSSASSVATRTRRRTR